MAEKQKKAPQQQSAFEAELAEKKRQRQQQQVMQERKESLENKRNVLSKKMKEAVDKYIEYSQKYGEEDMRTQFQLMTINLLEPLSQFLEVILNMEETMTILDESMSIVEGSMEIIDHIIDPTRHQATGLFARARTRSRTKRFMNLWKGRLKQMQGMMQAMNSGVQIMTSEMSSMMASFGNFGGKKNKKQTTQGVGLNENARRMVEDRKRELGMDTEEGSTGESGGAGAPAGGAPTGASDGGPGGLDGLV